MDRFTVDYSGLNGKYMLDSNVFINSIVIVILSEYYHSNASSNILFWWSDYVDVFQCLANYLYWWICVNMM